MLKTSSRNEESEERERDELRRQCGALEASQASVFSVVAKSDTLADALDVDAEALRDGAAFVEGFL